MILLAVALPLLYAKYVVLSYSFCNLHGHEILYTVDRKPILELRACQKFREAYFVQLDKLIFGLV
jgi:hypothetical protein